MSPFTSISFLSLIKLIWKNKKIQKKYLTRILLIFFVSFFLIWIRKLESLFFETKIKKQSIKNSPIFIIGHWRSGTTYLHNLMSQDSQFSYVSTLQAIAPDFFIIANKIFRPILNHYLPSKRGIDNVDVSLDYPQEEELALANQSDMCWLHFLSFPERMKEYFQEYVLLDNLSEDLFSKWKNNYIKVIRQTTYYTQSQCILLKNPANTARVRLLLDIFPDAKFIHIYRNPYDVYFSSKKMYKKLISCSQYHDISPENLEENTLYIYKNLMSKFLEEKHLIPSQNLVEVKFEDLEKYPLIEIKKIYKNLNLFESSDFEVVFSDYLNTIKNYKKNNYFPTLTCIKNVNYHLGFVFEELGYEMQKL